MSRMTCTDCNTPIPNGQGVGRTESFKQIWLHTDCAELRGIALATMVVRHLEPLRDASRQAASPTG